MQEFICPNGRMSVNGVCPIFEGDDGQIKDYQKPKTFDQKYNEIEDIEKQRDKSSFFKFDFENDIPSKFQSAKNIISSNIDYYNNFVENKLGIPSNVQSALRVGSSFIGLASGGGLTAALGPFALPFIAGGALKASDNRRIENITMQDPQGDIQTYPINIMAIQPTAEDIYRGGGGENRSYSSPAKTSQGVTSAQHQAFRM